MAGIEMILTQGITNNIQPVSSRVEIAPQEHLPFSGGLLEIATSQPPRNDELGIRGLGEKKSDADAILESAKDVGFEQTLQRLADGKFDQDDQIGSDMPEVAGSEWVNKFRTQNADIRGFINTLKMVEDGSIQVDPSQMGNASFDEALLLFDMLKNAKDEEERKGIFELLVLAMSKFLVGLTNDDLRVVENQVA